MKQYHKDKEVLKKATKQHKDRAKFSERTLETVGDQLEEAVGYLYITQQLNSLGDDIHCRMWNSQG